MNKFTLLLIALLFSFTGYSQLFEDFENTTGPDALPSTNWTLASGNWAVFDNGIGTTQRWGINSAITTPPTVYAGLNAAYVSRESNGAAGATSEDYLATPLVTIPTNGQLRFWARTFTNADQGTLYQIKVAPSSGTQNNPADYSLLLQQFTEDQLTFDNATSTQNAFNIYTEHVLNFPTALIGTQVYIAFVKVFTQPTAAIGGDRWLLDNVNLVQQCLNPTELPTTAQSTTATLNWAGSGNSFEIENILQGGTPTGIPTGNTTTNSFTLSGLTPNTQYCYYVRAICAPGNSSTWAGPFCYTTTAAPPVCGGNYVDSGGTTGNYANNEDITVTICPTNSTDLVTVTFTSFNVEATWDGLYVFDGNSIASPQIASTNGPGNVPGGLAGAFWGTAIPGPFTSSSPGGCLTFRFRSDGVVNNPGWASNITCTPAPGCTKPTALTTSAITFNSVNVGWTQPQNPDSSVATAWQVLALPCGSPAPTDTTTGWVAASTNPFNITGLNPDTCYTFYVRAICSVSESSTWSNGINATTQQIPPACGGTFSDLGGVSANYPNNADNTTTICPTNPGDVVTVTFTSFNTQANADGLYVFNGNSIAATQISSGNPAGTVPGGLTGAFWGTTIPGPFTSSSPDGCLTFRFRSGATVNAAGWVANVTCAPAPTCAQPTNLSTSALLSTSVNMAWTNNAPSATSWQVLALPCGSPAPTPLSTGFVSAPTNPFVLTGLSANTCYTLYVRSVCSPTDNSIWSTGVNITTQIAPPVCGGFFYDAGGPSANYANNSDITTTICPINPGDIVTVTFTAFNTEANWDGLYVFNGNSILAPQIASANPAANVPGGLAGSYWGTVIPGPFESSSPDGCLTFRFRSDGSVNLAGWAANVTCAPPPTCVKPTNVTLTTITSNSATISWNQPTNPDSSVASAWEILALPCGSPLPTATTPGFVSAPTNPFVLTGLSPTTCYTFYVRAVCSPTDSSAYSGGVNGTTQVAPPICGGVYTDAGGSAANYPNNSDSTVTICPTNPGEIVTVTFTIFNTEATWDGLYVFDGNSITAPQITSTNGAGNVPGGLPGSFWGNLTGANLPGPFESSSPDGCLTFRFRSDGSVNNPGWVANVSCGPPPTCRKPNLLTSTNITLTSATLGWNQLPNPDNTVSSAWQVLVLPAGSPAPTATSTGWVDSSITSLDVSSLTASTCYDFYVRSVCSDIDSSTWAGPFNFCTLNPPPISANTTQYTNQQLVEDVLLNTTCAQVTNVTTSTGINFNSATGANGIGYFNQNGSNFPFPEGVVLATRSVNFTPGPNNINPTAVPAWPGDPQLFNYIQGLGIDPTLNSYNDASILEFDFVPLIDNISFDFIFASEEYGTFQCTYSDAFAFFLTNTTTNVTTNLAVVPNTTTPISVITIRNNQFNGACASVNPEYFANYYLQNQPGGLDPLAAPINFNGLTVPMTATSAVIPGQQYHIKLVVADRNDSAFDSAVFLKGGSFNIGNIELGGDFLIDNGTALCAGSTQVISSDLDPLSYNFSWTLNGVLIPGENNPFITADQEGVYELTATYIGTTCGSSDSVTVQFYQPIIINTPNNLIDCNNTGYGNFILSDNESAILGSLNPAEYTITYYSSLADANSATNSLTNNYTNVIQYNETIYVRVENNITHCFETTQFDVVVQDLTPQFIITPDFSICEGTNGTITVSPINYTNTDVIYSWTLDGNALTNTTNEITVTQAGTYVVTINRSGCIATGQTIVTVTPIPVPDLLNPVIACGSYTLQPLTVGNYYTGSNATGNMLSAGDIITGSTTLYIYAASGTVPNCSAENPFSLTINPVLLPTFTVIAPICQNGTAPTLPTISNNGITGTWNAPIDTATVGTQTYTFTPATGECATTTTLTVTILAPTLATFTQIAPICQFDTAPALPTTSGNGITGTWSPASIDTNTASSLVYTFTPAAGQCATGNTMTIVVNEKPILASVSNVTACDSYTLPALTVGNYYSQPNGVSPLTNLTLTTSQNVYVYAANTTMPSCASEAMFNVSISDSPAFSIEGNCEGGAYVLTTIPANFTESNATYNWTNGTGQNVGSNATLTVTVAGNYNCTVAVNNCSTTEQFAANDIGCMIPSGISPNNDGKNDTFDLTGFNVKHITIVNRYGTTVYSKSNYTNQWYGQSNSGDELPEGPYYYAIERAGVPTKTGWVYVSREIK
jgi:gliding motility-associated-like protein